MKDDWKRLYHDIVTMRAEIPSIRNSALEHLQTSEVEELLAAVRACNVELIALRSVLEQSLQAGSSTHRRGKETPGAAP